MIIKIVTISLMAVFYICYFAKLISQKKQGIKTDQLGKGKEGFVKFIEVALKIITYLLPVIQIISIVFYSGTAHIVLQFTGVVITMFGVLAFIVSVTQMKENWRAGVQKEEKTSLVTTGIYSISRNPAFLGFDLMYIGILFSFFNWFLCFATGFAVVFFHLQIVNVEEDFLIEAFGNEYLQYKSKVCRYLGRKYYFSLKFSPAVDTVVKDIKRNPKRMQREAKKQMQETGIGTKSQQALKLQQEQNKQERKVRSREKKEADELRMFELKQQKKREKHRGH